MVTNQQPVNRKDEQYSHRSLPCLLFVDSFGLCIISHVLTLNSSFCIVYFLQYVKEIHGKNEPNHVDDDDI